MRESVIYQEILREGQQLKGATLILRQLTRRLGQLAPEVRTQIQQLPVAQLEELGEALLDFSKVQDLTNWLQGSSSDALNQHKLVQVRSVLRYQAEPLGELSTPPFFLLRSGLALWLRSKRSVRSRPAQSCRTEAMGLEVTVPPLLVFKLDLPLVFLAQTSSSSCSLPSLP